MLLHWPARFPWSEAGYRFQESVREEAGVVLPLAAVLRQMDMSVPRTLEGLLETLNVGLGDFADPAALGRDLIAALAETLLRFGKPLSADLDPPPAPRYPPCPEILTLLPAVPDAPGVYTFFAADDRVLYVGKAANLRARVGQHFSSPGRWRRRKAAGSPGTPSVSPGRPRGASWRRCFLSKKRSRVDVPLSTPWNGCSPGPGVRSRNERLLLVLPSSADGKVEVCLVSGRGAFHWERVPARASVPRGLWHRVTQFLEGELAGWGPGKPERPLTLEQMRERVEITLSWLVRHPGRGKPHRSQAGAPRPRSPPASPAPARRGSGRGEGGGSLRSW